MRPGFYAKDGKKPFSAPGVVPFFLLFERILPLRRFQVCWESASAGQCRTGLSRSAQWSGLPLREGERRNRPDGVKQRTVPFLLRAVACCPPPFGGSLSKGNLFPKAEPAGRPAVLGALTARNLCPGKGVRRGLRTQRTVMFLCGVYPA